MFHVFDVYVDIVQKLIVVPVSAPLTLKTLQLIVSSR